MNIPLKDEHLVPIAVDRDEGAYFVVADEIGWSTANLVPGFNRADTAYMDENNKAYPKLNEAVLLMLPYLNKFENDYVVSDIQTPVERPLEEITDPLKTYEEVRYEHEVIHVGEGWYTIYGFLLDTIPQGTGVYYDTEQEAIIDEDNQVEIPIEDLLERTDVQSADIHTYITVQNEKVLHRLVGELMDISMKHGHECSEYLCKQKVVHLWEGQISGGRTTFNDGFKMKAQQIIEDLENTDPDVSC